jgi:predicted dehydrogenase
MTIKKPLRGALVGFGKVAELAHLPVFLDSPDFYLVAVADFLAERRDQAPELLPQVRLYQSLDELLAREAELDFLDICTPPRDHTALALDALSRGCHVLCEKPLTLAPQDFSVLKEAAHQAQRALVTVHNWKYAPLLAEASKLIRSGALGEIRTLEWEVHRTSGGGGGLTDWRQEGGQALGGILIDHGWHAFYLLMAWAGTVPQAIQARLSLESASGGVDQEADVSLRFPGCQARMLLTWKARERRNIGRIIGTTGQILMEDDRLVLQQVGLSPETQVFPARLSAGSHHPEWMGGVLEEFLEEIADPGRRGRNLREAELCALLIRLAYQSHREGSRWVELPPP